MWPLSAPLAPKPSESELSSIPYDAPLSVAQPWFFWTWGKSLKGCNASTLPNLPDVDLTGKWIIISGANNGIGREAAIQFAAWGANLVLACREPPITEVHPTVVVKECMEAAKKAGKADVSVEWWEWDASTFASIELFCARWLKTGRALDILCNNAGMGSSPDATKAVKTVDGFEVLHQVGSPFHSPLLPLLNINAGQSSIPRFDDTSPSTKSCQSHIPSYPMYDFLYTFPR